MTPDELQRALRFRQQELRLLADEIGREINTFLGRNMKMDHPDVAYLNQVRAHLDYACTDLAHALVFAREPQIAATMGAKPAELEGKKLEENSPHSDHLAETLAELEGGSGDGEVCADVDRASGTQENPQ